MDILQRELIYLWYYFSIQFKQIFPYWVLGMMLGSVVSIFLKDGIHRIFRSLGKRQVGAFGIVIASVLGIASPLCMYGTIPIAASFSRSGIREGWLAAFMMSSVLLNPQLIIYSAALGMTAVVVRVVSCFLCGIAAGVLISIVSRKKSFFNFSDFKEPQSHDTDNSVFFRYIKNLGRNIKATGFYFFIGLALSAIFQRYMPADLMTNLFGKNEAWGVLMAATIGVPLYACGGGTIPLLQQWLWEGMSLGSASAFMITGPATKITNLGALKIVLGLKNFSLYLLFTILFSLLTGGIVNAVI